MAYMNFDSRMKNTKEKIEKTLPETDKKVLFDFLKQAEADGIGIPRQERLIGIIWQVWHEVGKHFRDMTKEDIIELVSKWENQVKAQKLQPWSAYTYKAALKKFFKWYKGKGEFFPEEVRWIKNGMKGVNTKVINTNELISEEDILKIIESAESIRDKAFLAVLFDSGARPKELITLKYGDVILEKTSIALRINSGKMGQRLVYLFIFPQLLTEYMNFYHPTKNPNDPLWPNTSNNKRTKGKKESISYSAAVFLVEKAIEKAGLKGKKMNLYNFRHSRASMLAKMNIPFSIMQRHMGHKKAQTTLTYIHLQNDDLKREMKIAHGLDVPEDLIEQKLKRRACPKCKFVNDPQIKYCGQCGGVLDIQTAIDHEEAFMDLLADRIKAKESAKTAAIAEYKTRKT